MSTAAAQPINLSVLNKVRAIAPANGQELLNQLITAYIKNTPSNLLKLNQAQADNDTRELGKVAHALKSSSLSVGADYMGVLLQKIEDQSTIDNDQSFLSLVNAVHIEFQRVLESLKTIQKYL